MNWFQNTIARTFGIPTLDEVVMYVNDQINGSTNFQSATDDKNKLERIFSNPALLKVFCLQCDMFSLGKVYVYQNGKALKTDPFLDMIKQPNPFQREAQFKWDFMFWNMIGNTYVYADSYIPAIDNKLYILENHKMKFPTEMLTYQDKIVLSKSTEDAINNFDIEYRYADGTATNLNWRYIIHNPDLSNGTGNWFGGQSRIDALYKIVSNSERAIEAKNVNLQYSAKFLVAGQADPGNIDQLPMGEQEKRDIETKMNGRKRVYAIKSMIDIQRFVSDIGALKLDDSYLADYFTIGSMYGIPKDVLEAFNSGTYENQEKARGAFVSYCLQPKGNGWFESLASFFGYTDKTILIDWEHLPFMQVFAKERAETDKIKSETLLNYMKAGVTMDQINEMLDMELRELNYETANRAASTQQQNAQESQKV